MFHRIVSINVTGKFYKKRTSIRFKYCLEPQPQSGVDFSRKDMLATKETIEKLYQTDNLEISYEASSGFLYCQWKGLQDQASVVRGGAAMLEIVKKRGIQFILNDNTLVTGSWWEAALWTADVWFPQMKKAGLRKFAWILSPNIFTELSAKRAMEPYPEIVKAFHTCEEAYEWLCRGSSNR